MLVLLLQSDKRIWLTQRKERNKPKDDGEISFVGMVKGNRFVYDLDRLTEMYDRVVEISPTPIALPSGSVITIMIDRTRHLKGTKVILLTL